MYAKLELFIAAQWLNGDGRAGEDVINPATEKPLAHLPHASAADLDRALEAAKKGFALWRAVSAYDRAKIMRKAADLMRERYDAIAKILVQEQGKVRSEAAKKGFALWRAVSAYDRAKIMRKAADLMRERYDAIAKILVQEQGKV